MSTQLYPIRLFCKKRPNFLLLGLALLVHLGVWGWLLYYIRPQEQPIFLHYNVLFGVDLTGQWYHVFALPIGGLCVYLINAVLAWLLYNKDSFASYVLLFTSVIVQLCLAVVAALLVFLNV